MNAFVRRAAAPMLLAATSLVAGCAYHVPSGPPTPIDQKAIDLVVVTGNLSTQQASVDQFLTELDQSDEYPSDFRARLHELVASGDLGLALARVYEQHLDARTIEGADAFWGSTAGRTLLASEPAVTRDSETAANAWTAAVSACASAQGDAPPAPAPAPSGGTGARNPAKARELLAVQGGPDADEKMLELALEAIDKTSGVPPGFRDRFKRCAQQDDFVNYLAPAFAKNLDDATLEAAIAYYRSDAGREMTEEQPVLDKVVPKTTAKWTAALVRRASKETGH